MGVRVGVGMGVVRWVGRGGGCIQTSPTSPSKAREKWCKEILVMRKFPPPPPPPPLFIPSSSPSSALTELFLNTIYVQPPKFIAPKTIPPSPTPCPFSSFPTLLHRYSCSICKVLKPIFKTNTLYIRWIGDSYKPSAP